MSWTAGQFTILSIITIMVRQNVLCHVGLLFAGYVREPVLGSLVDVTPFLSDQERQCRAT